MATARNSTRAPDGRPLPRQNALHRSVVKLLIKDYEAGASTYELAERYNLRRNTVRDALRRAGFDLTIKAKRAALSEEQKAEARRLFDLTRATGRRFRARRCVCPGQRVEVGPIDTPRCGEKFRLGPPGHRRARVEPGEVTLTSGVAGQPGGVLAPSGPGVDLQSTPIASLGLRGRAGVADRRPRAGACRAPWPICHGRSTRTPRKCTLGRHTPVARVRGASTYELAERYNLRRNTVRDALRRAGFDLTIKAKRAALSEEQKAEARRLFDSGTTRRELMEIWE